MSLLAFRRFGFAAWLVAIALVANLAAQNQLGINVIEATSEAAAVVAPADPHAHHHHDHAKPSNATPEVVLSAPGHAHDHSAPDGHTHKGHADCAVCGAVAAMAALTLPAAVAVGIPSGFARPTDTSRTEFIRSAARYALYVSRAPPSHI
ncbi:MAG: hypothetical protein AB7E79_14315 [Rhodospirillaceae bacterium]